MRPRFFVERPRKTGTVVGIVGILALAAAPLLGTMAAPEEGGAEGASQLPGAAGLAAQLDSATPVFGASQPDLQGVELDTRVWESESATRVELLPALFEPDYFESDDKGVVDRSDDVIALEQEAGVLAAFTGQGEPEPDPSGLVEALVARINFDPSGDSTQVAFRVGWQSESQPEQVLLRVLVEGTWSAWESLSADPDYPAAELGEVGSAEAIEVVVVPGANGVGDLQPVWLEVQSDVDAVVNVLAELVVTDESQTPADPGDEPSENEGPDAGEEALPSEEEAVEGADQEDAEEPGDGETEEPGDGETEESGDGDAGEPGDGETEEPGDGEAEEPGEEDAEVPSEEPQETPAVVSMLAAPLSARAVSSHWLTMSNAVANWNPGFILSDATLYTPSRMTEAQIKTFILDRGANCKSSGTNKCLKDQKVTNLNLKSSQAAGHGCKALSIPGTVNSWTAIKKVGDACGINPEVLLVFIQKESSGLTQALSPARWNKMMGVGCPDNQSCDPKYSGFTNQLYYSADWLGSYRYRNFYFNNNVGKVVTANNSSTYPSSCGTQSFVMQNQATASLYTYNPAVPTKAALTSWPGVTGNKCDSYGQRNVYMMMLQWFPASMQDLPGPAAPVSSVTWTTPLRIGNGWPARVIFPGDWDGNGYPDMMLIDAQGRLYLYPGLSGQRFGARRQIGNGWNGINWVQGGVDWDGDGKMDLVARVKATGALRLYPGNGRGGFGTARQIGHGWSGMSRMVLARSAAGPAIYAVEPSQGRLYYYPGNGRGGFNARRAMGTGWNAMTPLAGVGDWTGDGRPDLVARNQGGYLYLYPGKADGTLGAGTRIGNGWGSMVAMGGSNQQRAKSPLWTVRSDGLLYSYGVK